MTTLPISRIVEPYENVLIGNFLYALGLLLGSRTKSGMIPGCINLLQQTPLDKPIGDILLRYHPGVMRILEFKRSTNDSPKELTKLKMLEAQLSQAPHLVPISRSIHWFVETLEPGGECLATNARPYLDLPRRDSQDATTLWKLIEVLVGEVTEPHSARAYSVNDLTAYLKCLNTSKSAGSAGGLILHLDSDRCLRYAPVRDFLELRYTLAQVIQDYRHELERSRVLERSRQHETKQEQGLENSR